MRPRDEYTALADVRIPGQMAYGYRAGDNVPANVVADWGLVVGEDVEPANDQIVARPTAYADRREWEAYAVGQGVSLADARKDSFDDLKARFPDPAHDPAQAQRLRPAESAHKADWVEHVVSRGADRAWAEDKHTTVADLKGWRQGSTPVEATDTVAASATQQANG